MAITTVLLNPSQSLPTLSGANVFQPAKNNPWLDATAQAGNVPTTTYSPGVTNYENIVSFPTLVADGVAAADYLYVGISGTQSAQMVFGSFNWTAPIALTTFTGTPGSSLTTIVAGTLSATNPQAAGFATAGTLFIATSGGLALLSYTGTTSTTFTGLTLVAGSGAWTVAASAAIAGACAATVSSAAGSTITVNSTDGYTAAGFIEVFHTLSTTVAAGSNGAALSSFTGSQTLQAANPISAGFTTSGYIRVATSGSVSIIQYSGITSTGFTGCITIQGTGAWTLSTGGAIKQATTWVFQYTGTTSTQFTGVTIPSTTYGASAPPGITSVAANDPVGQYYFPTGAFIHTIGLNALVGQESNKNSGSIKLTLTSTLGLFPTQTNVTSLKGKIAVLTATPWPSGAQQLSISYTLPNPIPATPQNIASLFATVDVESTSGGSVVRLESVQIQLGVSIDTPNATPSVANASQTLNTVGTATPTIDWVYSHPDGLPQYSYRVVVFAQADVAATAGFNVNAPTPGSGNTFGATYYWGGVNGPNQWPSSGDNLLPVYDTGDIVGTASSLALTPLTAGVTTPANELITSARQYLGKLYPGILYRAFVFVKGGSSSGLYNVLSNIGSGAQNAGVDFMVAPEPSLMPGLSAPSTPGSIAASWSTSLGSFQDLAVRSRCNFMAQSDTDFMTGAYGLPGVGGWAVDNTNSSGTGTAPAIAAVYNGFAGATTGVNALQVTPYGTSTTKLAILSGATACNPGSIVSATARVCALAAGGSGVACYAYLVFYSAAGSRLATVFAPGQSEILPVGISYPYPPGALNVQTKIPTGAVSVAIGVLFAGGSGGTALWSICEPSINMNCINLASDPAFASGFNAFDQNTQPTPATAGWNGVGHSAAAASVAGTLVIGDAGVSNPGGTFVMDLAELDNGEVAVWARDYQPLAKADTSSSWLVACDAKTVPTVGPDSVSKTNVAALATLTAKVGMLKGTTGIATATITVTPTWTRFGTIQAGSNNDQGPGFLVPAASGNFEVRVANFQLEKVWTFTDGIFEAFTSGTAVPLATALGSTVSATAANPCQWWNLALPLPTGGTAAVSNGTPHSGTNCLLLNAGGTINGPISVEQLFTVSGLLNITPTAWLKSSAATLGGCLLYFYDNAGTNLSVAGLFTGGAYPSVPGLAIPGLTIPGTASLGESTAAAGQFITIGTVTSNTAWTQIGGTAITVPPTAAFARIVFFLNQNNGSSGSLQVDDVSIASTGTLAPSTPWIDGGYQVGGLSATSTVVLQHAPDGVTWATVRPGNFTGAAADDLVPTSVDGEVDYFDYEYPGGVYNAQQTVYFQAVTNLDGAPSAPNLQLATAGSSFSPKEWLLVDPLYGGVITLQVKGKVDYDRGENQTTLMPASRGAVDPSRNNQGVGHKVVMGDTYTFGPKITLPLQTLDYASYTALDAMLAKTYNLVLRSPEGEMWNVRKTQYQSTRQWQGSYTRPYRTYQLVFETVDANP